MKTKIITASSNIILNKMIQDMSVEGWEPIGSHSSVVVHSQNRYAGNQHMDTIHETEYSITMIKADPKMNIIKEHNNSTEIQELKEIMKYQE